MKLQRRRFLHLAIAAAVLPAASPMAVAQSYPDRPVRVVVPYAPGGPTDVVTRLIAQKLSERSGKQFYVENIGGGGGNIAMGRVAKMAPDGYTLLMVNPSYVVNPTLYRDLPYRFEMDFDPVSLAVLTTLVITVHPSVPARTLQELVALIKANPGTYSYASPGAGTPGHLVGEIFRSSLGLDLVHVPFNSAGLAVGSAVGLGLAVGRGVSVGLAVGFGTAVGASAAGAPPQAARSAMARNAATSMCGRCRAAILPPVELIADEPITWASSRHNIHFYNDHGQGHQSARAYHSY
jgi:hypothetical protein